MPHLAQARPGPQAQVPGHGRLPTAAGPLLEVLRGGSWVATMRPTCGHTAQPPRTLYSDNNELPCYSSHSGTEQLQYFQENLQ